MSLVNEEKVMNEIAEMKFKINRLEYAVKSLISLRSNFEIMKKQAMVQIRQNEKMEKMLQGIVDRL